MPLSPPPLFFPLSDLQTSAVLTGDSAIGHIFHFCSVLSSRLVNHVPLFEIDPPDYPLEWHAQGLPRPGNVGPYGCRLILPRLVDARFRTFSTPRVHPTKVSARRSVAFHAYRALYENRLLNEHLLPLTSVLQPDLEHEVRLLLKEVERRESTALVSSQFDPWHVSGTGEADSRWWSTTIEVDGLPPLRMLTQAALPSLRDNELPTIHTRERVQFKVHVKEGGTPIFAGVDGDVLARAREFTRQLFWPMYGTRMKWDQTDFLHLFIPVDESPTVWDERRDVLASDPSFSGGQRLFAPFLWFEQCYGLAGDISIVSLTMKGSKPYKFIRLNNDPITIEEKADLVKRYVRGDDEESASLNITYPLILARSLVKRNFLTPMPAESKGLDAASQKPVLLLKDSTLVALISPHEAQFAQWAPSIIRHLQMASTACSLRDALFSGTPMAEISLDLLLTATTTPAAQERTHYQRLETLGDTVLKFVVTIQLLFAYPLWSEGYLARRKDHAVSNANLSKMAMHPDRRLYKWIIRDVFVPKRWKPRLASDPVGLLFQETSLEKSGMTEKQKRRASVVRNLSTKVLADVVEALIGAAYLRGSFALGVECMKVFDLGLSWRALPECVHAMYSRIDNLAYLPTQVAVVEDILGYTFRRKAIAVEALMHASYQSDIETMSYERMEFLGDAVLDMLVTDYLYHVPGKDYGPGKIHSIKTAVVNAHFLAMLCLRAYTELSAAIPSWSQHDGITMVDDMRRVHLYKCLLHSNVTILNEQQATFTRWERPGGRDVIEAAFEECRAFPWSALTSLQAPKFLSDMFESLLGAVYLDSLGDLDITRDVLRRLGHWEILERIVEHNMDVRHPVSRLYLWASQHHEKVKCSSPKRDKDKITCSVLWDDYEVAKVEGEWRGRVSHEDVRFAVAEKATTLLEDPLSLLRIWLEKRSCRIEYTTEEAEGILICSAIVDGTMICTVRSSDISATSEEETKRAAAAETLKKLDMPVYWLTFLSAQHHFDVDYRIYEEDGMKVCLVYVNGIEAGKVEHQVKGPGPIKTEEEMMAGAAKEAIEGIERQVTSTESDNWEGAELGGSSDSEARMWL
jgi:endoribonuclease Dicer